MLNLHYNFNYEIKFFPSTEVKTINIKKKQFIVRVSSSYENNVGKCVSVTNYFDGHIVGMELLQNNEKYLIAIFCF